MKLKILLTGGTIDKQYDELSAQLAFGETHIPAMLQQGRSAVDVEIERLMLLDSLDVQEDERQKVLESCQASSLDKIIITHGTDTMVQTAALLSEHISNKTIVLVGAMIPYVFEKSDALFNLGAAITAVQLLEEGVYIVMNGKVFNWDNVIKNRQLGEFQTEHD